MKEEMEKIKNKSYDILKKCLDDSDVREKVEEYQKKFGTLTEDDLRKTFTI